LAPIVSPERIEHRIPFKHGCAGLFYCQFHSIQVEKEQYKPLLDGNSQDYEHSKMQPELGDKYKRGENIVEDMHTSTNESQ
jgi:hypothetical protein